MELPKNHPHDLQITPAKVTPGPAFMSAIHLSAMAITIVASILLIVAAMFSTAQAGMSDQIFGNPQQGSNRFDYAPANLIRKAVDFPAISAIDNFINNQKNPKYQAAQLRQAARAVEMFALAAPVLDKPVAEVMSAKNPNRPPAAIFFIASILVLLMSLMVWITWRMWRDFARQANPPPTKNFRF